MPSSRPFLALVVASILIAGCGDVQRRLEPEPVAFLKGAHGGPQSSLELVMSPVGSVAGSPLALQPVVRFVSPRGTLQARDARIAIAIEGSTVALEGTTSVEAVNGIAVFADLSISTPGTYTLLFTAGGARETRATVTILPPNFSVAINVIGDGSGVVSSNPAGITCPGVCTAEYPQGTLVSLTAVPTTGSYFVGWSGACSGSGACGVTSTSSVSVTAEFAAGFPLASISADSAHTCGVAADGASYCWGRQNSGLGDGVSAQRSSPVRVGGGLTLSQVALGQFHTCGLTVAGAAYCWGSGGNSQIGDGGTTSRALPTPVSGGHVFESIAAGWYYTCGITSVGKAYCWGYNGNSQLGVGNDVVSRETPSPVASNLAFTAIDGARYHTCGLSSGQAYCWGSNSDGQLGNGSSSGGNAGSPVPVIGGLSFVAISVGGTFFDNLPRGHACALTPTGAAYCWGHNGYGERGTSAPTGLGPSLVAGGHTFTAISAGSKHSCAITPAGEAYCWGDNANGQLGDGTVNRRFEPTTVAGGLRFSSISAGDSHTCGITTRGGAYCWGSNTAGQLGDGTMLPRLTPARVMP